MVLSDDATAARLDATCARQEQDPDTAPSAKTKVNIFCSSDSLEGPNLARDMSKSSLDSWCSNDTYVARSITGVLTATIDLYILYQCFSGPSATTFTPCSPFCPGVTGIPELECSSCHSLFHPVCVGIPSNRIPQLARTFRCKVGLLFGLFGVRGVGTFYRSIFV